MNNFIETLDEVLFEKMINMMKHACIKSVSDMEEINFKLSLKKCINDMINILENSKGKKRLIMFSFFNNVFSNINTGICNALIKNVEIKKALYNNLHTLIKEDQSDSTRKMTSNLLCLMLRLQNLEFILSSASNEEEARTFCVLFTNLASVDIRSILPTVMKKLTSQDINEESHRLSTDYEILESMIIYLSNSETVIFQFSELLLLQRSFKEAFEESIDFLKDRWDNFNKNKNSLKNDPEIFDDLIVISSVRSLCLWLKEDDSLRKYAISIMDMFMYLWNKKNTSDIDYRLWICDGLQGIITTEEGWNSFHNLGIWNVISTDLIKNELEESDHSCIYTKLSECDLLLQAIERYQNPQENWIDIIKHPKKINKNDPLKAEFLIKIIILSLIIFQKLGKHFSKQNEQLFSEHLEISLTWIHFLDSKKLNCSWTIPIELKDKMLIHLQDLHSLK
ncbi:hypothetical protein T552_01162 [Pneumocystis carinii B80]|uniref:Neurochondrin n=1 Tax=Pneumocystis carinii (strain B80) TaxID=1408658 RepID=A0A0W4ZLL8_PNEC8|nr:hypothetical protein T552_01162 [Pneumocystis carinii B80]KTW29206.1 hypothetical protein T552_01162 [Pneumocystis carinii B80]